MLCIEACAQGLLKLARQLNSRGQRYVEIEQQDECRGCRQCAEICPETAIEIFRDAAPDEDPGKASDSAGSSGSKPPEE